MPLLRIAPDIGMDGLRNELKKYKENPGYHQIYRAKQKALEMIAEEEGNVGGSSQTAPPKAVSMKRKKNDGAKGLPNRCSICKAFGNYHN